MEVTQVEHGGTTTAQYEPGSGAPPPGCIPIQLKAGYVLLGSQFSQTGRYGNSNTFRKCVNSPTTDRWTLYRMLGRRNYQFAESAVSAGVCVCVCVCVRSLYHLPATL